VVRYIDDTTTDDDDEADNDVRRDYLDQHYAIGVILSQLPLRSSRTKRRWRCNEHIIMARFIH